MTTPAMFAGYRIVDADTHWTEPHDLWTSRAPVSLRERVPQVVDLKGSPHWVCDGVSLGRAGASGVVARDGAKVPGTDFFKWSIDDVHEGAHSIPARLAMMDERGVSAQIVYPNTIGFGGQRFAAVKDEELRLLVATIYNDALIEMAEESGDRLFGMGVIPWWDRDASVTEIERVAGLGLHGINTTTAPHEHGLPDLGDRHWDPLWEAVSDLGLPVNFHIGASDSAMSWFGSVPWPSLGVEQKLGLGSAMLYLNNAGVIGNMIYSGVLERHPKLNVVSVESGVGWIPFALQALDYGIGEMSPGSIDYLSMAPSDYFRRQMYSCFWFEGTGVDTAIETLGVDHVMFETDFPHPTCVYPGVLEVAAQSLAAFGDEDRRKIMGGNAERLYRLPAPAVS